MIETNTNNTTFAFPPHDIDSSKKDKEWHYKFSIAIYKDATTRQYQKIFFAARDDYRKFKEYGLSMQTILQYRKWLTGAEPNDKTWTNINWNVPPIWSKYRNIVINKLLGRRYNINCTPIDPAAVDETAKWFAELKAKMKLRDVASRVNPELLQANALRKGPDDPEDMEEFEMKTQLGFKTKLAMDAELGVSVVFEQGGINEERRMVIEDLVDLGVGIYKDWVDDNDQVCFRRVNPINFGTSYCRRGDFGDANWWFELTWLKLSDIAPYFTAAEMKDIAQNIAGKNGNPKNIPYNFSSADYDKFKVLVQDAEYLSYNTDVYEKGVTKAGNVVFGKTRPKNYDPHATVQVSGSAEPKYKKDVTEVLYKCCWVVDTTYVYSYGLATDQKRKKSEIKRTKSSYHAYAPDFYEMKALGLTERVIPLIDNYCMTWFKVQNFLNKWIPYIVEINYDALENVNIGKGGKKMEPMQLLDMLAQTNMIVVRKKNAISGLPEQNNAVNVQATQMAGEIQVLLQQMETIKQMIRDVTGLNEAVDGTGPQERTNIPAVEQAAQGANNAIEHIKMGDSRLLERLADGCLMRLQRVIKRKPTSGYVHALGSNYIKFVQVSPDITLHEYAIKMEDQPDEAAKQAMITQLNLKNQEGLIEPEDWFTITNMTNLKEAQMTLIYRVKKRKELQQQNALQQQQQTGNIQVQSAQATSQFRQQELMLEYKLKIELANVVGNWSVQAAAEKAKGAMDLAHVDTATQLITQAVQHESDLQQIQAQGQVDQQTAAAQPAAGAQP